MTDVPGWRAPDAARLPLARRRPRRGRASRSTSTRESADPRSSTRRRPDWLDVMTHQAYGPRTGVAADPPASSTASGIRGDVLRPRLHAPSAARRSVRAIRDAGHEIAHHGYLHEGAHGASAGRARSAGLAPRPRRARRGRSASARSAIAAPMWELTLRDAGASSPGTASGTTPGLMDADHPYLLAASAEPGAPTIVELPVHWALDDWEPYIYLPGHHRVGRDREPGRGARALDARARRARRGRRPVHAHEPPVRLGAGVAGGRARAAHRAGARRSTACGSRRSTRSPPTSRARA